MRSWLAAIGFGLAGFAAPCAPACAQNTEEITVGDYINAQYYPTVILGMKFSGDAWDIDSDHAMQFGDWSVNADPTTLIYARYHPADSDLPQSVEVGGLSCQIGGTGEWFGCYMALADARGIANAKSDRICAIFADGADDERHSTIECPASLEILTPPVSR